MKKITKAKYPEKTSINLAMREDEQGDSKLYIALFALFLVALGFFVKFAVVNQMAKATAAEAAYTSTMSEIQALEDYTKDYAQVKEEYSHYSNGYLNEEESAQADRMQVLNLIESCVFTRADVQSFELTGNTVTVTISETQLTTVSAIVSALQADERTEYVTVYTAGTNNRETGSQLVTANIMIELRAGGDAS